MIDEDIMRDAIETAAAEEVQDSGRYTDPVRSASDVQIRRFRRRVEVMLQMLPEDTTAAEMLEALRAREAGPDA